MKFKLNKCERKLADPDVCINKLRVKDESEIEAESVFTDFYTALDVILNIDIVVVRFFLLFYFFRPQAQSLPFHYFQALGVEPRFARHLMLRCHRFVLAETGYEERRKQELTSLAIETGRMLQHVDHDCSGLQKQLAIILDSVVKSCKDLEETIDDTHMLSCAKVSYSY